MTDLDQRMRRVRIALLLLGIPFLGALTARAFQAEILQQFPVVGPDAFDIASLVTGALVALVVIVGWFGDRQTLRRQERRLLEQANELALHRQRLEARDKQHGLELSLKDKQIEKEVAIREERVKYFEFQQARSTRDAGAAPSDNEDSTPAAGARRGPPPALSRPRRTLVDAESDGDTTQTD